MVQPDELFSSCCTFMVTQCNESFGLFSRCIIIRRILKSMVRGNATPPQQCVQRQRRRRLSASGSGLHQATLAGLQPNWPEQRSDSTNISSSRSGGRIHRSRVG